MDESNNLPLEGSIPGPGNLSFFDLSQKGLKQFPSYLYDECVYVQCLYLEGNLLEDLGESFFPSLQNLRWLDVRKNKLQGLPKTIAHHPNLEVLLLQNNNIEALPLELGLVPKLRGVQLSGNPITFPPPHIIEKGVQSILEFLREERDIQAPSPSSIRPIAEPFYQTTSPPPDRKFKSRSGVIARKSPLVVKKRAVSSSLPLITVKSYQKLCQDDTPTRPASQYRLTDSPDSDLSSRIHSVGSRILQLWPSPHQPKEKSEARIQNNLLKEMFVARIRDMLVKQAAIIQRSKDQDVLSKWRKSGTRTSNKLELSVWPYDTDPVYMSMLTRAELQGPTLDRQRKPVEFKPPINIGEEMTEIFKSLEELDNCRKDSNLSPRTEQQNLNNEIQTLVRLQKKLQVLHVQNVAVPSLPVRGQQISVGDRK